jgi:hypothetical protein
LKTLFIRKKFIWIVHKTCSFMNYYSLNNDIPSSTEVSFKFHTASLRCVFIRLCWDPWYLQRWQLV